MKINACAFHGEVKQNSQHGYSHYVCVAQHRLPTTGSKSFLLPTRSNNTSLAFSQIEATTSPDLGRFSTPVPRLLAFLYYSHPHDGDYRLPIQVPFARF